MPPKSKFTRDEIIAAALKLAADKGPSALTARSLAARLGTSTRPIFTAFRSMDELMGEVRAAALACFEAYAEKARGYSPIFKQIGLQMIMFAAEQPKLFCLTFMTEKPEAESFEDVFRNLGDVAVLCVDVIGQEYGLDRDHAMMLFRHCWIFTYGVGTLIATKVCSFSPDEVSDMLSREFVAMLGLIKSGRADSCTTIPEKRDKQ